MGENKLFDEVCVRSTKALTVEQLQTIGKNIRRIRLRHKLTQSDLSYFIFSDKSLISLLERGKSKNITLLTLIKIADALKVKLADLFSEI